MAKREKDKLFYEVTKEKPFGAFHILMVGGSAGSVLAFLIVSLVGAYEGIEIDTLVLLFLMASIIGFLFGSLLTWLGWRYLEEFIPVSALWGGTNAPAVEVPTPEPQVQEIAPAAEAEKATVVEDEEGKGKSIDFIFPELSPDKQ